MTELTKNENDKKLVKIDVDGFNYPIAYTPAKVDFVGQDDLNSDISKLIEKYDGFDGAKVSASEIDQVKRERTYVNKLAKALTDNTNNIVKLAGKELLDFELNNKSIVKKLNAVSSELKIGVDKFTEKQKKDKHEQNLLYITKQLEENSIPDTYLKQAEENYNPKWDNKTYSYKTFQEEVKKLLDTFVEDQKKRAQEVVAVVDACKDAVSSMDSNYFIKRLDSVPLVDVLKEIREHDKEIQHAVNHDWDKTAEPEQAPQAPDQQMPQEPANTAVLNGKTYDQDTGELISEEEQKVNVVLQMQLTKTQLRAFIPVLKKYLKVNNIDSSAIKLREV